MQVELVEQVPVELGEPGDAGQRVWARCAVETGMDGRVDAGVLPGAEQLGEACDGLGSGAAMQQQERMPLASFVDGDVDWASTGRRESVRGRGHRVPSMWVRAGAAAAKSAEGTVA